MTVVMLFPEAAAAYRVLAIGAHPDDIEMGGRKGRRDLSAVADAYVRNGSFAGTNLGTTADLVVKTDALGWTQHSYVKFDLGGISGAITNVKLRPGAGECQWPDWSRGRDRIRGAVEFYRSCARPPAVAAAMWSTTLRTCERRS
jgi:hypothetical protein